MLTPRSRRLWATRRAALERHRETLFDQDHANVAPVGLQRSAVSTVVAEPRALLPRGAGALDVLEVEVTGADQLERALRGPDSELTLRFPERVRRLGWYTAIVSPSIREASDGGVRQELAARLLRFNDLAICPCRRYLNGRHSRRHTNSKRGVL